MPSQAARLASRKKPKCGAKPVGGVLYSNPKANPTVIAAANSVCAKK